MYRLGREAFFVFGDEIYSLISLEIGIRILARIRVLNCRMLWVDVFRKSYVIFWFFGELYVYERVVGFLESSVGKIFVLFEVF